MADRAPLHKRAARSVWTFLVWLRFMRELWAYGWTERDCWQLAIGAAEFHKDENDKHGWLVGRWRITPAEAVAGELECWSE